ncbi:MAG: MBOAT family O-acyltransferase [Erysipelotrichaceae bacterium]|nr:MBOAT family O-acyltransferase [Erysipelotrichaceae bacterium]
MSWNAKYVFLILFTTIISYICALLLEKTDNDKLKKLYIFISLLMSFGVLFVFKYLNFAINIFNRFTPLNLGTLNLLLPVGISFYTFQTVSYVIDVYRGKIKAEKHFGIYATFVSFFPQLVAGPIERSTNLLPQIKEEHKFDSDKAYYGIGLMLWGLFKKIVVADNLAIYVDKVYENVGAYSGFALLLVTMMFAIQIYCDFSGYSDMARGSAKLFGVELMENFKSPYFASSIKEFWSRWHISLSTWFKDYLYIPLGGNRVGELRNYFNLVFTFLISGLWHGAGWHYIIWGGMHGVLQVVEKILGLNKKIENKLLLNIKRVFVFLLVTITWIFFRSNNIYDSVYILKNMLIGISSPLNYLKDGFVNLGINNVNTAMLLILYIVPLGVYDYFSLKKDLIKELGKQNNIIKNLVAIIVIIVILFFAHAGQSSFVYFQF